MILVICFPHFLVEHAPICAPRKLARPRSGCMISVVACNHTTPYLSVVPTLDYRRTWSFSRLANNASLPPRIHNTIRDVSSSTCSRVLLTQCRSFCSICLPVALDVNLLASSRTHKYPRSHLIPHVDHQLSTRSCGLASYFTLDSMHRPHVRVRYTCLSPFAEFNRLFYLRLACSTFCLDPIALIRSFRTLSLGYHRSCAMENARIL
ncbi:hypothetical protein ARMSODRAFT_374111 [Armillaria solidipes]|uniref:Uncharacterized protein n=1 Tax=Armillaria solidipes TaxID=1076256 RepID=A0A2H3BIF4_9AGAR|nr:hypothetical protein ARMSODRAFT_374111 [Armillaria solidipes]